MGSQASLNWSAFDYSFSSSPPRPPPSADLRSSCRMSEIGNSAASSNIVFIEKRVAASLIAKMQYKLCNLALRPQKGSLDCLHGPTSTYERKAVGMLQHMRERPRGEELSQVQKQRRHIATFQHRRSGSKAFSIFLKPRNNKRNQRYIWVACKGQTTT